jgi:hypothetical protein
MAAPSNPSNEPRLVAQARTLRALADDLEREARELPPDVAARLAEQIEDAIDAAEAARVLGDSTEERIPWAKVKARLGL